MGATINTAITDYIRPGGKFHVASKKVHVRNYELEPVIYQLARNQRITKIASLPNKQFLIYIEGNPVVALVTSIDGWLHVNIYADTIKSTFDVDDGY